MVFLDVVDDAERAGVCELAKQVAAALASAGVPVAAASGGEALTPHCTIAKMSKAAGKPASAGPRPRHIPADAIAAVGAQDAGRLECGELLLCSMSSPKAEDGFYAVVCAVPLTPQTAPMPVDEALPVAEPRAAPSQRARRPRQPRGGRGDKAPAGGLAESGASMSAVSLDSESADHKQLAHDIGEAALGGLPTD